MGFFEHDFGLVVAVVGHAHDLIGDHLQRIGLKALGGVAFLVVAGQVFAHVSGQLGLGGLAAQFGHEGVHRRVFAGVEGHRGARQKRQAANLVEHGAADAGERETLKGNAQRGVERARSFDQTDHAHLNQFVDLHEGRDARLEVNGHPFDHGHVGDHQTFAGVFNLRVHGDGFVHGVRLTARATSVS